MSTSSLIFPFVFCRNAVDLCSLHLMLVVFSPFCLLDGCCPASNKMRGRSQVRPIGSSFKAHHSHMNPPRHIPAFQGYESAQSVRCLWSNISPFAIHWILIRPHLGLVGILRLRPYTKMPLVLMLSHPDVDISYPAADDSL